MIKFTPVFGAANFWTSIQGLGRSVLENLTLVSWVFFAVAGVVAGIMFATGRNGSEMGKSMLGKIVIGIIVVAGITALVSTIASAAGGSASF